MSIALFPSVPSPRKLLLEVSVEDGHSGILGTSAWLSLSRMLRCAVARRGPSLFIPWFVFCIPPESIMMNFSRSTMSLYPELIEISSFGHSFLSDHFFGTRLFALDLPGRRAGIVLNRLHTAWWSRRSCDLGAFSEFLVASLFHELPEVRMRELRSDGAPLELFRDLLAVVCSLLIPSHLVFCVSIDGIEIVFSGIKTVGVSGGLASLSTDGYQSLDSRRWRNGDEQFSCGSSWFKAGTGS